LYGFADDESVENYLARYPFLTDVLYMAHAKIREYFGPSDQLSLKVVEEPDLKASRRLFVLIHTTLRPREALTRLDELDHDWWLDALPATKGKLTIDIYYN